jgi:hypothetical protein
MSSQDMRKLMESLTKVFESGEIEKFRRKIKLPVEQTLNLGENVVGVGWTISVAEYSGKYSVVLAFCSYHDDNGWSAVLNQTVKVCEDEDSVKLYIKKLENYLEDSSNVIAKGFSTHWDNKNPNKDKFFKNEGMGIIEMLIKRIKGNDKL